MLTRHNNPHAFDAPIAGVAGDKGCHQVSVIATATIVNSKRGNRDGAVNALESLQFARRSITKNSHI